MTDNQRLSLSVLVLFPGVVIAWMHPTITGYALAVALILTALAIAVFDERVPVLTVRNRRRGIDEPLLRPSKGKTFSWLAIALPVTIWAMQWAGMILKSDVVSTAEAWGLWFFDAGESPLLFMSGLIGVLCRRSENG